MTERQSAHRGVAGADLSKAARLFEVDNTQTATTAQPLAGPRYERKIERVHALGVRPLGEMLDEIATATGRPDIVADRVEKYARLDAAVLRGIGGDRFPPHVLGLVR